MMVEYGGIAGLIILILDIWAIVSTLSSTASVGQKVLWILLILILPLAGVILWFLLGPRGR